MYSWQLELRSTGFDITWKRRKLIAQASEVLGLGCNFVLHSGEQKAELKHAAKVEDP